jgi:hypothetical protein
VRQSREIVDPTLDAEGGLGGNPAGILELVADEAVSAGIEGRNDRHGAASLRWGAEPNIAQHLAFVMPRALEPTEAVLHRRDAVAPMIKLPRKDGYSASHGAGSSARSPIRATSRTTASARKSLRSTANRDPPTPNGLAARWNGSPHKTNRLELLPRFARLSSQATEQQAIKQTSLRRGTKSSNPALSSDESVSAVNLGAPRQDPRSFVAIW